MDAPARSYAESIIVARPAAEVYDLVSDVTRTGEWSPVCRACWWDEGDGPRAGAWFTGRNETSQRTWESRSRVVSADPGERFSFEVGPDEPLVRWTYRLAPVAGSPGSCELTELWEFLPAGIASFHSRYGDNAQAEIEERTRAAHHGIPATLAAIKATAEAGAPA